MKKKRYTCEQLSEMYDIICAKSDSLKKLYPDVCDESVKEFEQIEKTVEIVKQMQNLSISDIDNFISSTITKCESSKRFKHSIINKISLPAAAAIILLVGALSYNAYNIPVITPNNSLNIASEVVSEASYIIKVSDFSDMNKIKLAVLEHGGVIINESDGRLTAKSKITNYITLKRDLTLSEEDKIFYNRSRNLLLAGSNSNVYSSDYIDQTIIFDIVLSE
jgi:hypothetical protein